MTRTISLLFVSTMLFACATTPSDEDVDVTDDSAEKADGIVRPTGVYSRTEATGDQLTELMLFPDKTFIRYAAFGDYRERGTYQFTKSTTSTKRYIRFLYDNELVDRYVYTMNGSVLRMRLDSESATYPMFSVATGKAAWVAAIKTDWFDEAFLDWGAEAFPRTGIHRGDLPAAVRTVYDSVAQSLPPNSFPLIYRFELHGQTGYEISGGTPRVRLFDAAGQQVASGDGEALETFEWN